MNNEIRFSNDQLADASGSIDDQVTTSLGSQRRDLFDTTSQELPRPEFQSAIYVTYGDAGLAYTNGVEMDHSDIPTLKAEQWHNMRVALGRVSLDNRIMWHPATLGPHATAAYLETDAIDNPSRHGSFSEIQHLALDNAYLTLTSSADHASATNAAESRHGLILASQASASGVHATVHRIDRSGDFTSTANADGLQDITTKTGTRQLRPRVIPLAQAHAVVIRPEFQPAADEPLFGLKVPAQQLLIASTLAATRSRGVRINVGDNLSAMVEETS